MSNQNPNQPDQDNKQKTPGAPGQSPTPGSSPEKNAPANPSTPGSAAK